MKERDMKKIIIQFVKSLIQPNSVRDKSNYQEATIENDDKYARG